MTETKHFIYCLEFYDTYNEKTWTHDGTRRYIGRTKNLKKRWAQHKAGCSGATRQQDWDKCRFILEDVGNEYNIKQLEQKWINHYGLENLLNRRKA